MKTIICKSPEEYRDLYDKLINQGLYKKGNSSNSSVFADCKTQEEKIFVECPYVSIAESVDKVNIGRPDKDYTEEFFESVYREANKPRM